MDPVPPARQPCQAIPGDGRVFRLGQDAPAQRDRCIGGQHRGGRADRLRHRQAQGMIARSFAPFRRLVDIRRPDNIGGHPDLGQ